MSTEDVKFLEAPIKGSLRERLGGKRARFRELEEQMADPETQKGGSRLQEILKEHGAAAPLVTLYGEYLKAETELEETKSLAEGDDARRQYDAGFR